MLLVEEARKCCFVLVGNIPAELRSADLRAFFSHLVERRAFACFHFRHRPEHLTVCSDDSPSTEAQTVTDTVAVGRLTTLVESGAATAQESSIVPGQEESSPSETAGVYGGSRRSESADGGETSRTAAVGTGLPTAPAAGSRCCVAAVRSREYGHELRRRYGGRHWAKAGGALLRRKVKLSRLQVCFDEAEKTYQTTGITAGTCIYLDFSFLPLSMRYFFSIFPLKSRW